MASFPSIRIEGGLLGPDILDQAVAGDLPGQKATDFGLEGRRNLTDEMAAVFTDAKALWGVFQNRLERLDESDVATSVTRDAWVVPFLGLLGYEVRYNQKAYDVDGMTFAVSHRAGEAEDAPPLHIVGARQELGRLPASGRPRMAPHSLLQEYLNRTESLWGVVTNGLTLRVLRDCTLVRRQAYVEFDLAGILEEQRFADFRALYRLLHRTRLPHGAADAGECLLEKYYAHSVEQGGRVRDHLRDGVEECITRLANGFLSHPANAELQKRVQEKNISDEEFYRELLRLIYRFLFLLVAEDRGLLSPNPIYREHYGVVRLRRLLQQRAAFTAHGDLWHGLRLLWRVLGREDWAAMLDLAPLNGELFAEGILDTCQLSNRELLSAFWYLAWYQESPSAVPRRVNYAALDVEELGSVYESLLEFHPALDTDASGRPVFKLVFGSERKTTGSYYTPPSLVNELIQSALDPVIEERLKAVGKDGTPEAREKALLAIRVCDPACGSGHFLLAAARRIGKELARVRTGEDEPAPERLRESVRDVIGHCIYGVDRNRLAVDLCRVALWIESHTAGKPLGFLDHRIRPGDSLVGVLDLTQLSQGIPDEAFKALEGDDKTVARETARRNKEEKRGLQDLFAWNPEGAVKTLRDHSQQIGEIPDDSPELVRKKRELFDASHADPEWRLEKDACDLWTAAFYQALTTDALLITSDALARQLGKHPVDPRLKASAAALAHRHRFFHWPLEFPEVVLEGGFDVVLSNPPWEHVELKEQEFFAARDSRISAAPNKAARSRLINGLAKTAPDLHSEYLSALQGINAARLFLGSSGRYPLCGRGRINTYAVFAELASGMIAGRGRCGLILPTGIATDDTTKDFFASLVSRHQLVELIGFENEKFIFPAVHHAFKFCKFVISGDDQPHSVARIGFFLRDVSELREEWRFFRMSESDFSLLSPNTGNCPIFRTGVDAEMTKAIYRRVPVFLAQGHANGNPWGVSFKQGLFNMASDSHHFRTAAELLQDGYRLEDNIFASAFDRCLPLYEAKMVFQFDHRFSTYEGATEAQLRVRTLPQPTGSDKADTKFVVQPKYWVREEIVDSAIPQYPEAVAAALQIDDRPSLQRVLLCWAAGYHFNHGSQASAEKCLDAAMQFDLDKKVASLLPGKSAERWATAMARSFPLTEAHASAIEKQIEEPESLAIELVRQFSPQWFIGWRDVSNSTNERSLVVSAVPRVAVGHKLMLIFSKERPRTRLCLLANLCSFAVDFCARQKIGGMSMAYFIVRQLPVLPPERFSLDVPWLEPGDLLSWISSRALELAYTAEDLGGLARDCGYAGRAFVWDDERRFELRCELDAAFFHLYLQPASDGGWGVSDRSTAEAMSELRSCLPTPRDAVVHIMDQFNIVRDNDLAAFNDCYRTKDRILAIYDAMLEAQHAGRPYKSSLNPPPGER